MFIKNSKKLSLDSITNSTNSTNPNGQTVSPIGVGQNVISAGIIGNPIGYSFTGQMAAASYTSSQHTSPFSFNGQSNQTSASPSTSPILPNLFFQSFDNNNEKVLLTLKPEFNITSYQVLQIIMMIHSVNTNPLSFSVFHFVKENNLECHFKYSKV